MSRTRRTALSAAAAGGVLLVLAPGPDAALRTLREAGTATDPSGPLVAAVALLAWALLGWLLLLLGLTLTGRLPGLLGRAGRALSRRIAPAAVRRAVEVTLGLSLAAGVVGAGPAVASPGISGPAPATGSTAVAGAPAALGLDWTAPAGPSLDGTADADLDAAGTTAPPPPGSLDWPATSSTPAVDTPPVTASPVTAAGATDSFGEAVVVRPGDTLWGLAEQSLRDAGDREPTAAEVARAWPSWWSANREAVGADPDLLRPGTALTPPPASSPRTDPTTSSTDSGGGADGAEPASS